MNAEIAHRVASEAMAKIVATGSAGCVQVTRRVVGIGHATVAEYSLSHRLRRQVENR